MRDPAVLNLFSSCRREVLKRLGLVGASVLSLPGCEQLVSAATDQLSEPVPKTLSLSSSEDIHPGFHLLSRAGFGPRPGDLERLEGMGHSAWLEEQLHPEAIPDYLCDLRVRRLDTLNISPASGYEFRDDTLLSDLQRNKILRAIYSKRQLQEVMVDFWSDHLNISINKDDCLQFKAVDDREVIRKHALGNFKDMILASATSPAMLDYLDGRTNRVRMELNDKPNENYARELFELHTLGIDGGYTQDDIFDAARCLSGWGLQRKRFPLLKVNFFVGRVHFNSRFHDPGEKLVLGQRIPAGGGADDLNQLVNIVCRHPSTAEHIATKLCRYFVSYQPPKELIARVETVFIESNGDIKSLLREILGSDEFRSSSGQHFKRPFRFIISSLRALGADTHAHSALLKEFYAMGHAPFEWSAPDGYPLDPEPWFGSLGKRWNFALRLSLDEQPAVRVPIDQLIRSIRGQSSPNDTRYLFQYLVGRIPTHAEYRGLSKFAESLDHNSIDAARQLIGVILASPAYQYS